MWTPCAPSSVQMPACPSPSQTRSATPCSSPPPSFAPLLPPRPCSLLLLLPHSLGKAKSASTMDSELPVVGVAAVCDFMRFHMLYIYSSCTTCICAPVGCISAEHAPVYMCKDSVEAPVKLIEASLDCANVRNLRSFLVLLSAGLHWTNHLLSVLDSRACLVFCQSQHLTKGDWPNHIALRSQQVSSASCGDHHQQLPRYTKAQRTSGNKPEGSLLWNKACISYAAELNRVACWIDKPVLVSWWPSTLG